MGEPFIHLAAVQKIYRTRGTDFLAISEATFDVEAGELVSLVGPSGCGKTTLLKILAGLHPVDSGELTIGSQRGPLIGPLDLRDVHYKNDTMDARIGHVALTWHPRELRSRQLDVESLHAEKVRIVLSPSRKEDTSDGKLVDIHLPVNIVVRDALIRDV